MMSRLQITVARRNISADKRMMKPSQVFGRGRFVML